VMALPEVEAGHAHGHEHDAPLGNEEHTHSEIMPPEDHTHGNSHDEHTH
jgi:hypothetical protein